MKTLSIFSEGIKNLATETAWYVADLSEAKGKQELFTHQSPQRLKLLREHALIESAVSSNRIEGIEIDNKRIGTVLFGKPLLQDRNEEEIQGYRDALEWIHQESSSIRLNQASIKKLHNMTRGSSAKETSLCMKELLSLYSDCIKKTPIHPLLLVAAFNLDFLCIHPFRDGNGRVSRLLLLLQLYHAGYEVGRFISLERLIEEHKERYYETLELCSQGWHQGKHNPWPYNNFLLYLLKKAYNEFIERVETTAESRGIKTELVIEQIKKMKGGFSLSMLMQKCPDVSKDMIRKVLKDLKGEGQIESTGKGAGGTMA